jgi:L-ectoine synthase
MIVRRLEDLAGAEREVEAPTWVSRRFPLARDGMGSSMHETILHGGTVTEMEYKHHLEAVYCIGGEGELEVLPDGPVYPIRPGTLYALDGHERHVLRAASDLRMVCVFNPPVTGREVHGPDGTYPLLTDEENQP